jgi:hypothetical protein
MVAEVEWFGILSWYWCRCFGEKTEKVDRCECLNVFSKTVPFVEDNSSLVWVFRYDNDPKHATDIAKELFFMARWKRPLESPDLSPVENLRAGPGGIGKRSAKSRLRKVYVWVLFLTDSVTLDRLSANIPWQICYAKLPCAGLASVFLTALIL